MPFPPIRAWQRALVVAALAALPWHVPGDPPRAMAVAAQPPGDADEARTEAAENEEEAGDERGIFLPTDRGRERQLDRAKRLIAGERWSDAATMLDELLAGAGDAFIRQPAVSRNDGVTTESVKSEAARLIAALPKAGREAYEAQFRGQAERSLAAAVARNDFEAIVSVARRWLSTAAGRQAALLAAVQALESGHPLAAAAWLDRLAADEAAGSLEPTLSVMRAVAWRQAGDTAAAAAAVERARTGSRGLVRIAGRDVAVSFPAGQGLRWLDEVVGQVAAAGDSAGDSAVSGVGAGEWRQPRGGASRNGIATASRPLLAARFRVPVARHPAESRLLEDRRQAFADQDVPLFPAALPLAVDGTILLRTPLGLLAVDFATGKRIWLQPGAAATDGEEAEDQIRSRLPRTFDNLTDGGLSSDGRLVFAVDSHPDAFLSVGGLFFDPVQGRPRGSTWQGGNTLSAYDIRARGRLRWRLPAAPAGLSAGAATSTAWFMGAPLVVGDRLFVMVEERGEVRLDVLRCGDGSVEWSQPLAELDESQAIRPGEFRWRQRAGLSPALGGGILVCPLGNGSVVAIDLATRVLQWAHAYRRSQRDEAVRPNGFRGRLPLRGGVVLPTRGDTPTEADRWRDEGPIVVGGSVLLTPHDADELICLDLRSGTVRWTLPRERRLLSVAGVVDGRVVIIGRRGVEAVDLATGRSVWKRGFDADGAVPSGRGVLTADRLFLPLDVPEVIEVGLVDGTLVGRSPARGGAVPGNLVAYRGEMIALGTDFLDVFHQVEALGPRVETALRSRPDDPWAMHWSGQLEITRGRVEAGMDRLLRAERSAPGSLPPDGLTAALAVATDRDFAAAAPFWNAVQGLAGSDASTQKVARHIVDGFLRTDDRAAAWQVCSDLLDISDDGADGLFLDGLDRRVQLTDQAWFRGRLERLRAGATAALALEIDAALAAAVSLADATVDPLVRLRRLESLAARFGDSAAGHAARRRFVAVGPGFTPGAASGNADPVRRDLFLLQLGRTGEAADRAAAGAALAAVGRDGGAEAGLAAWKLGRVNPQRPPVERRSSLEDARARPLRVPVEAAPQSLLPGISLAYDQQLSRVSVLDGYGRQCGESLVVDRPDVGPLVPGAMGPAIEAVSLGRVLYVRSAGTIAAFAIGDAGGNRRLWTTASSAGRSWQQPFANRPRPAVVGIHRQGGIPLGERISEPEDPLATSGTPLWCGPRITGVPVYEGRTLTLLDPGSGAVLWKRHRLPPATELLADEDTVCVCTPDGRGSIVLGMADGRMIREIDLPDRRRRLYAAGRLLLTIAPGGEGDTDRPRERVVLEVWDPLAGTRLPMGQFSGSARVRSAGPGRLVVLEPSGTVTLLDVTRQAVAFVTTLGDMPREFDELHVVPWMDRLLVMAARRADDAADNDVTSIIPLQQTLLSGHDGQMRSYSIWALDASSGAQVWNVPATVSHHALHPVQPADLPVLLFCRQIQGSDSRDTTQLSVLCLDKRTGHAVFEEDRIRVQPHLLYGCDMTGDPAARTITLFSRGGDMQRVVLEFTGAPLSPRTPHQASARPPRPAEGWDAWLERTLRRRSGR